MTAPEMNEFAKRGFFKQITAINIDNYKVKKANLEEEYELNYEKMKNYYPIDFNQCDIDELKIPGGDG